MHLETLTRVVRSPRHDEFRFVAELHQAGKPEEQLLEPAFYQTWRSDKMAPQGIHHELLLKQSPAWHRYGTFPIHVHCRADPGKSRQHFVCYTGDVTTAEQAGQIFTHWSIGTVYSMEAEKDFGPLLEKHPEDFVEFVEKRFGIELVVDL